MVRGLEPRRCGLSFSLSTICSFCTTTFMFCSSLNHFSSITSQATFYQPNPHHSTPPLYILFQHPLPTLNPYPPPPLAPFQSHILEVKHFPVQQETNHFLQPWSSCFQSVYIISPAYHILGSCFMGEINSKPSP